MSLPINRWSIQDRPREKFYQLGKKQLTDSELLAIIIRNGTKNYSALQIAQNILAANDHSLEKVKKMTLNELTKIRGIGKTKAISILSAFELSDRCSNFETEKYKISSSKSAFELMKNQLNNLEHEEFHIILLNRAHIVLDKLCISKGGITSTIADGRIIFKEAIIRNATSIILVHNHPSGNLKPSEADLQLTKNLKEFGKCIDISIVDHLIIADNFYFSFADERLI
jgi:DNA repair protein RadC